MQNHYTTPQELAALHKRGAQCLDGCLPIFLRCDHGEHRNTPALSNLRPSAISEAGGTISDSRFMRAGCLRHDVL